MVVCPKCGYDNELGRMFCHKCGVKLELDEIRPERASEKELRRQQRQETWTPKRITKLAIRVAILAVLAVLIAMMLQVPPARDIKSTDKDGRGIDHKRLDLERMIQQKKAGTVTLTEAEIDSYMKQMTFVDAANHGLKVEPTTLQIELGYGDVTVVMIGKIKLGGSFQKSVEFRYVGVPTVESGHFVFQPTGGYIGRMPIQPKILNFTGVLDRYYTQLFHSLSSDREVLLDPLASISVDPGRGVELKYDPAQSR